jgi:tRNA threonylcarbamoyl adenosine modification protein YeaZ
LPSDLVLGLETSGPWIELALVADGRVIAEERSAMERGQAEALMPLIDALLARESVKLSALSRIGVGTGPGNFTGVRLSVSLARGLALGLGIPAIGVTRFQARAHGLTPPFAVVEDARNGACYLHKPGEAPRLTDLSALPADIGPLPVTGSAAEAAAALTGGAVVAQAFSLGAGVALVAAMATLPQPRPAPLYLRAPDAAPARPALPVLP